MPVDFRDNSAQVLGQMAANISRAADAVGVKAVNLTLKKMESGYGRPIRKTGDLMRDVNFNAQTDRDSAAVTVGNSLQYAIYVHEGTVKMGGRPYLRDAITQGTGEIKTVWESYLRQGF